MTMRPIRLPASTSDMICATSACASFTSRLKNSFRFCIVPPTAPIEHIEPTASR